MSGVPDESDKPGQDMTSLPLSTSVSEHPIPLERLSATEQPDSSRKKGPGETLGEDVLQTETQAVAAVDRKQFSQAETLETVARSFPLNVPEGHKLVHIMRHARAWHK
jgi:hypothetical protein